MTLLLPSPRSPIVDQRLPDGFAVRLSPETKVADGGATLFGSSSGRLLYLSERAQRALAGGRLSVVDDTTATLARILTDRGMADPAWDGDPVRVDEPADLAQVTLVVPVRDRPEGLVRLLGALPPTLEVVVVDDGSADELAVARAAANVDAHLVRLPVSRGPAAARNAGMAVVTTPFAVFVDSDVVPEPGWVTALRRHFDDPTVAIAAPRVLGREATGGSWLHRYEAVRSSLDLGPSPALVRPHARVAYVPSATLMVRRSAWGDGFDECMPVAEDVDLVWRMTDAGWRVRYEPAAVVRHDHRTDVRNWLSRKAFYGTGAALLAERHGDAVAPMVVTPWTGALVALLLAQRRWSLPAAVAVYAATSARVAQQLRRSRRPLVTAVSMTAVGAVAAAYQTASALTRHYWPVAVGAALVSRRARRALVVAAVVDGVLDFHRTAPALDPVRYVVARRLDDLAYGAGVWFGAARARSPRALLPSFRGFDAVRVGSRGTREKS